MKVSDINSNINLSPPYEIIKPKSIKLQKSNLFDTFNNFFPDNITIPENLSEDDLEALKQKNKYFFQKYSKIFEKNSLLKFKLQDLTNKKNEIHKFLTQLEHKKDKNVLENENNINIMNGNNTNLIGQDLINFQSNIYINRKRKRRKKSQIICKYFCPYKDCNKKYATEGALNQHKKFKHEQK